ncbi:sigma-54 interaction domain-containing protein [Rhodohalobacter mucosus]|uniref:Sigma-54-dependent Fis family transcriptional regulator n=1 Tax=Rhodohalobacter mucosus TaxID=2079485 RepID=A0A316TQ07_9BACT|nr:sigma-54 dependent transcriptional regulator [Rhodohalobacter mucosus]PWN05289.1 sigma-54-dependent Fis family transcriptional regulator [Rhodohalobacter mucosus]
MDREALQERYGITGESAAIRQVVDKIMQVAGTDITVLLQGESGVGKDVTARAIHALSNRKRNNLVIVNCGAIPEGIIESELFGHEKGSFTGAHESRKGYFEKADGGTIFLDEIGDTPKNIQVKLLRVLESGEFFRVGSSKMYTCDVRVIAATNQDLWELVREGKFREDLYYRLDTVKIKLPPLRERKEDIIPIFKKFVNEFSSKYDSVFKGFSDEARELLTSYRWPGNVRELRNVAEQLVVLEKSQFVDKDTLQKYLKGRQHLGSADNLPVLSRPEESGGFEEEKHTTGADSSLIYRALLEMRTDISDLKKMLANFLYSTFSDKNIKALPSAVPRDIDPNDISSHLRDQMESESLGIRTSDESVLTDEDTEEASDLDEFFSSDEIPSIEEAEKFLIQQALRRFEGNRRKASEALGVSERTLYRKLDQYGLQ